MSDEKPSASAGSATTEPVELFELDEYVVDAVRAGASGFLGKGVQPSDFLDAIRVVAGGEALLSPRATRALERAS